MWVDQDKLSLRRSHADETFERRRLRPVIPRSIEETLAPYIASYQRQAIAWFDKRPVVFVGLLVEQVNARDVGLAALRRLQTCCRADIDDLALDAVPFQI